MPFTFPACFCKLGQLGLEQLSAPHLVSALWVLICLVLGHWVLTGMLCKVLELCRTASLRAAQLCEINVCMTLSSASGT